MKLDRERARLFSVMEGNRMEKNFSFSVSMCVYGGDNPEWFRASVNSILYQTLPPDEIVLVVDGPVPENLDIVVREYERLPFFRVYRLEKNQGHGEARRFGLKQCKNELVALMDADDICIKERFRIQTEKFAKDNSLDVVGGIIAEFIGEPDNVISRRMVPEQDEEIKKYMKIRCPMNQVTVMLKKTSVENVGGYIDWYCDEDYYLWLRMALAGMKFYNCQDVLVKVRTGKDQFKRRGGVKYFRSEAALQRYMLEKKIINVPTYMLNIVKRMVVQIFLPGEMRAWVFKKFARE